MRTLLLIPILMAGVTSFAAQPKARTIPIQSTTGAYEPDVVKASGTFEKGRYENGKLAFGLSTPAGWIRVPETVSQIALDAQRPGIIDSRPSGQKKGLNESMSNFRVLFQFTSSAPGSTDNVAVFACGIEKLRTPMSIKEYAESNRDIARADPNTKITKDLNIRALGGKDWDSFETEVLANGSKFNQLYLTTLRKGYAVFFVVTLADPSHKKAVMDSLNSINFYF